MPPAFCVMNIATLRTTAMGISQAGMKKSALTKAAVGFTKVAI
jgi:hypothetical protein